MLGFYSQKIVNIPEIKALRPINEAISQLQGSIWLYDKKFTIQIKLAIQRQEYHEILVVLNLLLLILKILSILQTGDQKKQDTNTLNIYLINTGLVLKASSLTYQSDLKYYSRQSYKYKDLIVNNLIKIQCTIRCQRKFVNRNQQDSKSYRIWLTGGKITGKQWIAIILLDIGGLERFY
ncbi:hypothetical protein pb186bvf_013625 [Paramecium bursaria]